MTKNFIISLALATTLFTVSCNNATTKEAPKTEDNAGKSQTQQASGAFNLDTTKLQPGQIFFQCDMHPEVLSEKQAPCPKCDMDLTEITKK